MPEADRLRLAGRVPADYVGYGYAPLLADDMKAVAAVAGDVAVAAAEAEAGALAAAESEINATSQAIAAQQSAAVAAAAVSANADRTVGRRPSDPSVWTFTRATPAWGFGVNGALEETAIDTLRWEFDPVTRAPLGAAFAGARTNVWTNPRGDGLVAGAPGTVPTGVGTRPANGLVSEIVGQATRNGIPGWEFRITGTPTSTGVNTWALSGVTAHLVGDWVWTAAWFALVGGSLANIANMTLRGSDADTGVSVTSMTATPQFFSRRWISTSNSGTQPRLRWSFADAGVPVDCTIWIGGGQQRVGVPFLDAPIFPPSGSPGVSTRAQGNVTIPVQQFGARLSRRQGLIILDWNSQPGPFTSALDADWMGLVSWGDTTADNRMGLLINPDHTSIEARCTAGGVVQTASAVSISAPAAGITARAALAWDRDAGFMQVAARGVAGTKVALTAAPAVLSNLMPGRYATSHPLFGRIQGLECRPAALFDASLAALT